MGFIDSSYEVPQAPSKYTRLEEGKGEAGKNVLRILGSFEDGTAIMGYEYWVTGLNQDGKPYRKPIRKKMDEQILPDELEENPKTGEIDLPKHFWAMPVYNYKTKSIQIWEVTQKVIIRKILEFARNPKWGDPKEYDLLVYYDKDQSPSQMYSVDHDPKEPLEKEITEALKSWKCNIKALFDGADPFEDKGDEVDIDEIIDQVK